MCLVASNSRRKFKNCSSISPPRFLHRKIEESLLAAKMFRAVALFGRKKSRPFKVYYNEWFNTLENSLLPRLRHALASARSSTILSTHVDAIHRHFEAYYDALDLAATNDVSQLLFPEWRNALEKPFLWLGDLHPYLFTKLLRSFLNEEEEEEPVIVTNFRESSDYLDKPWHILMAWESGCQDLMTRIEQIECVLRLRLPSLVARGRKAQSFFVERIGSNWGRSEGKDEEVKSAIGEAMAEEMEELVSVFVDANRLRISVLTDILSATNVYQAALFLEGLAQFLVGFHDQKLLREFDKSKTVID